MKNASHFGSPKLFTSFSNIKSEYSVTPQKCKKFRIMEEITLTFFSIKSILKAIYFKPFQDKITNYGVKF